MEGYSVEAPKLLVGASMRDHPGFAWPWNRYFIYLL